MAARRLHYRTTYAGLPVSIENRAGSFRFWKKPDGTEGRTKMLFPYGYIRGTEGADGDHVDCFIGPNPNATHVYIVNQRHAHDGRAFDEHKVLLGWDSLEQARAAYLACYDSKGPELLGSLREWTLERFKAWIASKTPKSEPVRKGEPIFTIAKAQGQERAGHKYKSRKPDGKGGWLYEYDEPQKPSTRTGAIKGQDRLIRRVSEDLVSALHEAIKDKYDHPHIGFKRTIEDASGTKREVTFYFDRSPGHTAMDGAFSRFKTGSGAIVIHLPTSSPQYQVLAGSDHEKREPVERYLRQVLAHEITHALDPHMWKVKADSDKTNDGARTDEQAYRAYVNQKHEVTAHIKEIERDLLNEKTVAEWRKTKAYAEQDRADLAADPDWTDALPNQANPVYFALAASPRLRALDKYYTPQNKKRVYRAIFEITQRLAEGEDGAVKPIKKSEGPFVGPKGGKWADPAHTIPWVEDHHAEAHEGDTHFQTGKPATFPVTHRAQKTQHFGAQYGQDIEPHGRYVVHGHWGREGQSVEPGGHKVVTTHDTIHFKNPLVIQHNGTGSEPGMWKRRLAEQYGKKGKALSRALAKDGHDGIVTVHGKETSEIVDLRHLHAGFKKSEMTQEFEHSPKTSLLYAGGKWHLLKSAVPPGSGWAAIPRGKHGGFRRRRGLDWEYWYPNADNPPASTIAPEPEPITPEQAPTPEKSIDPDPRNWAFYQVVPGQPTVGWEKGGVKAVVGTPVKEAGVPTKLYVIDDPHAEKGWARLRNVTTGETRLVEHHRVYPVVHRPQQPKKGPQDPTPEPTYTKPKVEPREPRGPANVLPAYADSKAAAGTGLAAIEGGTLPQREVTTFEPDAYGNAREQTNLRPAVPTAVKLQLLDEFAGMLQNVTKKAAFKHGLSIDQREDVRASAVEGFLTAIERYPGGAPFASHALSYAMDYARVAAGRMRGVVTLPQREQRLRDSYIAARATAARQLGVTDPTPEQVVPFWTPTYGDLHRLAKDDRLRKKTLPADNYTHGEQSYLGRLGWATELDRHITAGANLPYDETAHAPALPGVSAGYGLSDTERADVRHSISDMLQSLSSHEVTIGEGAYRANTGEILRRTLGMNGEPEAPTVVAQDVPMFRRVGSEWKALGDRQRIRLVDAFMRAGLAQIRARLSDSTAGDVVEQALTNIEPVVQATRGPTYRQLLEARSRQVLPEQVREWRSRNLRRWSGNADAQRHIRAMGDREVARRVVHEHVMATPLGREMHRAMTQTVTVEPGTKATRGIAVVTLTDPATGAQRRVRMATIGSMPERPAGAVVKSMGEIFRSAFGVDVLPEGFLLELVNYPRLMQLLFEDMPPTPGRSQLETLLGFDA